MVWVNRGSTCHSVSPQGTQTTESVLPLAIAVGLSSLGSIRPSLYNLVLDPGPQPSFSPGQSQSSKYACPEPAGWVTCGGLAVLMVYPAVSTLLNSPLTQRMARSSLKGSSSYCCRPVARADFCPSAPHTSSSFSYSCHKLTFLFIPQRSSENFSDNGSKHFLNCVR